MTPKQECAAKEKLLTDAAASLMEIGAFDAVVVLATWRTEAGDTAAIQGCEGNWYAQNGLADYFLVKRRHSARLEQESQSVPEDE